MRGIRREPKSDLILESKQKMASRFLENLYQILIERRVLPELSEFSRSRGLLAKTTQDIVALSSFYIDSQIHHKKGSPAEGADCRNRLGGSEPRKGMATPWSQDRFVNAYLSYFLPLNYVRALDLLKQGRDIGFLGGLAGFIDYGCGPGTVSLAIEEFYRDFFSGGSAVEQSAQCFDVFDRLREGFRKGNSPSNFSINYKIGSTPDPFGRNTLVVFSYSLNELPEFPSWALHSDHLLIMDPADRGSARRLLELRSHLIAKGYYIWAPCTHQLACPMLEHSQRDWCHHRMKMPAMPFWFQELEQGLPMKNQQLEYSYLMASRRPPPQHLSGLWRITGDLLVEKGKTRQMVCFNDQRLFLAHLTRHSSELDTASSKVLSRGDLVQCRGNFVVRGNEVRDCEIIQPITQTT